MKKIYKGLHFLSYFTFLVIHYTLLSFIKIIKSSNTDAILAFFEKLIWKPCRQLKIALLLDIKCAKWLCQLFCVLIISEKNCREKRSQSKIFKHFLYSPLSKTKNAGEIIYFAFARQTTRFFMSL